MKKNTKFLVLLLALLMMCLCLTGCDDLDNMRKSHAHWTVDGDTSSITLNGVVYKELKNAKNLNPLYNSEVDDIVYITNSDVPVLLSTDYGVSLSISADKNFITGYLYDSYDVEHEGLFFSSYTYVYPDKETGKEVLYCKEDMYDELSKKIEDGIEFTKYGYGYYTYEEEGDYLGEYNYYYLSDEESKAIDEVIKTVKPNKPTVEPYNYMYVTTLDKISDDKLFAEASYEIFTNDLGEYSLERYSYVTEEYTSFVVPDKFNDIFDKIVEKAMLDYETTKFDVEEVVI